MDTHEDQLPAIAFEDPSSYAQLPLTSRELEVLEWVSKGKTNEEIGRILDLKPRTASKHLQNIYVKLGVRSRTAAVVQYLTLHRPFWFNSEPNPSISYLIGSAL